MPPAQPDHLGIPLTSESFPSEHRVGCRYWVITEGKLGGPCETGQWMPGLNRGACRAKHERHSEWKSCSCGLYCFAYDKTVSQTGYFNMKTAVPNTGAESGVVGGIAYWYPRTESPVPGWTIVSAKYAAVAALTFPKGASQSHRNTISLIADEYGVEIVDPGDLADAVDQWVAERMIDHFDPPAQPTVATLSSHTAVVPAVPSASPRRSLDSTEPFVPPAGVVAVGGEHSSARRVKLPAWPLLRFGPFRRDRQSGRR